MPHKSTTWAKSTKLLMRNIFHHLIVDDVMKSK